MVTSFQISPTKSFSFINPEKWPKWIQRYHLASGLSGKMTEVQVNVLIYHMGDQIDDIHTLLGFWMTTKTSTT